MAATAVAAKAVAASAVAGWLMISNPPANTLTAGRNTHTSPTKSAAIVANTVVPGTNVNSVVSGTNVNSVVSGTGTGAAIGGA